MDFREYTVIRDGTEVVIHGTIHEPVHWDFSIRLCEDDLPGIAQVALQTGDARLASPRSAPARPACPLEPGSGDAPRRRARPARCRRREVSQPRRLLRPRLRPDEGSARMKDYDVIVVGGGINGLTAAAYLAKAGMSVAVFEARGQCGAHCDTVELGLPGLPAQHPRGLAGSRDEPGDGRSRSRSASVSISTAPTCCSRRPSATARNCVQALDPTVTQASLSRLSSARRRRTGAISQYLAENALDALEINQQLLFRAPNARLLDRLAAFQGGLLRRLGIALSGDDLQRMNGFEVLELLYESEEVRTTPAALGEFTGQWPLHRRVGSLALNLAGLSLMPVHTARGGSHALTHALVRCFVAHGGDVWSTCPVEKILVQRRPRPRRPPVTRCALSRARRSTPGS